MPFAARPERILDPMPAGLKPPPPPARRTTAGTIPLAPRGAPRPPIDRTGDRVKRIHVELSNGTIRLISYAYFVEAFSTSDRMMAFLYTQGALLLDGENLRALLPALQDESVTALRAYRPDYHLEPEAGAVVITRLEWQTREQVLEQA